MGRKRNQNYDIDKLVLPDNVTFHLICRPTRKLFPHVFKRLTQKEEKFTASLWNCYMQQQTKWIMDMVVLLTTITLLFHADKINFAEGS